MKTLDLKKTFRLYLPSILFAGFLSIQALDTNNYLVSIIMGAVALFLISNIFFKNLIISRILGTILLLGSLYIMLAWLDDVIDREASIDYLFGLPIIIISIIMSVLLIIGYKNSKSTTEVPC